MNTHKKHSVPALSCDCHTHVFGPVNQYPYALARQYTPGEASIEQLLALGQSIGTRRVVIVQPSPYGSDNRCTMDALRAIGDNSRGVAVIDETTSNQTLDEMHVAGIRGIRLNLETNGIHDRDHAVQLLRWAAQRIQHLGWHVQIYTNLSVLASLANVIREIKSTLVIDHFCGAKAALGITQPHFETLLNLVRDGLVWVKLSAVYRVSDLPDGDDVAAMAKALIAANPDRMLWGSDWPHPGARPTITRNPAVIEPFNDIDDARAIERLTEWVDNEDLLHKILVTNPATLYEF